MLNNITSDPIFLICVLYSAIIYYNGRRNGSKLHRAALVHPRMAPWFRLLNFGDDMSPLNITGFTRYAFMQSGIVLLENKASQRGRPALLDFRGQLGH